MRDISCKLLSTTSIQNDIGVSIPQKPVEIEILRLRISVLNYNNEKELIYIGTTYTIIRVQEITADELILICERKIKNVKDN